jgi:hypothetical protein
MLVQVRTPSLFISVCSPMFWPDDVRIVRHVCILNSSVQRQRVHVSDEK